MLDSHDDLLKALHDPLLDGLFHSPRRIGVESAWYGHVPFGYWIVLQARPRMLVELGTHNGVSYSSFCDAVLDGRLATRCFAVDTWQGDEHAGHYGEEVFVELSQFHDQHYRRFSTLLRMNFDTALGQIPDGSIDLLHIDGEHTYDAVNHDFAAWRPKLSERALVLFHDTNVRERDFGVWRLWQELRLQYPGFEFSHAHGLGVLLVGPEQPATVMALCELSDPSAIRAVRDRFALLGERWHIETVLRLTEQQLTAGYAELAKRAKRQIADLQSQRNAVAANLKAVTANLSHSHEVIALLQKERDVILGSTLWRATAPIRLVARHMPVSARRLLGRLLRPRQWIKRRAIAPVAARGTAPDRSSVGTGVSSEMRVVFISGESHTPGHHYRVVRSAAAVASMGIATQSFTIEESKDHLREIADAAVVLIWRYPWSDALADIVRVVRDSGGKIVYDVDDLMFLPELARADIIDGIRSQNFDADAVATMFSNVRRAMLAADICTCPTTEIALRIRAYQKPAVVLPNGFDEDVHRRSRFAVRQWRAQGNTDLVRIGYAAGSRTHQKDFAVIADAVVRVLRARRNCQLVLFRGETEPVIDVEEYPALDVVADQIEWRLLRPLQELPDELARFDINLAPLEVANPFCEAKSELKFFEAALVDVCTIASPTGPFQRSIRDGETGILAVTPDDWYRHLIELVDNPERRQKIGHAAYLDVLWSFGPQRRAERVGALIRQLQGGASAAQATELELLRDRARLKRLPIVPLADAVFHNDQLGDAEVTVVIPVFNYAQFVVEALDSVLRQTLETIDLIVVDDASTDDSLPVVTEWAQQNSARFNRILVLQNRANAGLSLTRNAGIDAAETPFVFLLDADNRILPECCAACLEVIQEARSAFAYPRIKCFGDSDEVIGVPPFEPMRLAGGNYIDAMAMVAKWSWAAVGGYSDLRDGWEDYDFWCSLVEHGSWGTAVPRVLAEYRVHGASMLHTTTDIAANKRKLIGELQRRHPWLAIPSAEDFGH